MSTEDRFDGEVIDARNCYGETRLILAARCGDIEAVKRLVGEGANVTLVDNLRKTARTAATLAGHDAIAQFLASVEPVQPPDTRLKPEVVTPTAAKKDDSIGVGGVLLCLAAIVFFVWLAWPSAPKEGGKCSRWATPPPGFICR